MAYFSYSKLGTFKQCKYKFKLQYIEKVEVDIQTTIEMYMGQMVHFALQKLYESVNSGNVLTRELLLSLYDKEWFSNWKGNVLIVNRNYVMEDYLLKGRKFISEYYEHYKPFNQFKTIGLETSDFLTLQNGDKYSVRIDRLAKDSDGNYYVCDYKTNNSLKSQDELDSDEQLAMYSLWVHNKFDDCKSVKLIWYFLAHDTEMISERSTEQLNKLHDDVVSLISEVKSCKDFPTNPSKLCDWCIYKGMCPAFGLKQSTLFDF
ncbi:PD-(D/E)XK nuclease family protein [Candidatus Woesearchaeota archaeon]|nr:PD-(D/E)XK nuclease family protein [Candidatus Woesearchaeota archaeon]